MDFEKKFAEWQGSSGEMIAYIENGQSHYDAQQIRITNDGMVIDPEPVDTYFAEIDNFSKAVLNKTVPWINGNTGIQNMKVIVACYESPRTGQVVEIG